MTHIKRNPLGLAARGLLRDGDEKKLNHLPNPNALENQAIVTAIPAGRRWRVKAISGAGDVTLLGVFDGRLAALGAAVLLAEQAGGRVVP